MGKVLYKIRIAYCKFVYTVRKFPSFIWACICSIWGLLQLPLTLLLGASGYILSYLDYKDKQVYIALFTTFILFTIITAISNKMASERNLREAKALSQLDILTRSIIMGNRNSLKEFDTLLEKNKNLKSPLFHELNNMSSFEINEQYGLIVDSFPSARTYERNGAQHQLSKDELLDFLGTPGSQGFRQNMDDLPIQESVLNQIANLGDRSFVPILMKHVSLSGSLKKATWCAKCVLILSDFAAYGGDQITHPRWEAPHFNQLVHWWENTGIHQDWS